MRINPQAYLPNLNQTIKQIEALADREDWSVSTIRQLRPDIQIFKGPRFKSENMIVEKLGPNIEPYYTPSAILQEKSESAKFLDISKASPNQLKTIQAIRVKRGDIVITRSGTIGRVVYITQRFHGAIASDDLIRVKIPDEQLRLYVFAYLQTTAAQNQMLRNEYGAVQQHLEPDHIADILIPLPNDLVQVAQIINSTRDVLEQKEKLEILTKEAFDSINDLLTQLSILVT